MFDTSWIGPTIQSLDAARQQWWNYQEARHVERFGEQQTNTAMQRRVADLRAAGINPLLAVDQGGAASAPGVAAPGVSADIGGAISSALSMKRLDADISQIQQNIENMKTQQDKTKADTAVSGTQAALNAQLQQESATRSAQLAVLIKQATANLPGMQVRGSFWQNIKDLFSGAQSAASAKQLTEGDLQSPIQRTVSDWIQKYIKSDFNKNVATGGGSTD